MRARSTRRAVLAACGVALAGCTTSESPEEDRGSPPENPSWPMFGFDAANTGFNTEDIGPQTNVEKLWHAGVRGYYTLSTPVIADDTIYIGSGEYLYAIDTTGDRQWSTWLGALTHHFSPAIHDDLVYVGGRALSPTVNGEDEPGTLFALSRAAGSIEWEVETHLTSAPIIDEDTLYLSNAGGDRGYVLALDPTSGAQRWETTVESGRKSGVFSAPAVTNGHVYATGIHTENGSNAGSVVAVDADDGEERWRTPFDDPPASMPVVSDEKLFFTTRGGSVLAVSEATGETEWEIGTEKRLFTAPAVADGTVYVSLNGTVLAVDAETGAEEWRNDVEENTRTGLSVVDGTVYVGGNSLYALAGDDGSMAWQVHFDGVAGTFGTPSVVGGTVYSGTCVKPTPQSLYDNYIYAVGET